MHGYQDFFPCTSVTDHILRLLPGGIRCKSRLQLRNKKNIKIFPNDIFSSLVSVVAQRRCGNPTECQFIKTRICLCATFCLFSTMSNSPHFSPFHPCHCSHPSFYIFPRFPEALNSPRRRLVYPTAGAFNSSQLGHLGDDVFIVSEGFLLDEKQKKTVPGPVKLKQLLY